MISERRVPRQQRALVTRAAIVDAAGRILLTEGAGALNTNRIAKVAGVSVGSLYQYFPNKEAVLGALAEREGANLRNKLEELIKLTADMPVEQFVDQVIHAMFAMRERHALLIRISDAHSGEAGLMQQRVALAESLRDVVRRVIQRRSPEVRPVDADVASFVIVHAIQGQLAALDQGLEPWFMEREELVAELVILVQRYLRPQQAP